MHCIEVQGKQGLSKIMVGERLANLPRYLPQGRTIVITDENVKRLYADRFPPADVITIGCGERHKTLDTLAAIYDRLIALSADRSTFLVGIGGGIVGDVSGFAASTYMRGLRFGFVATTLLAQVDATVGGKNGVNFKGYKNMVGVFNQPEFVIADIDLLDTLPPAEIASGLAEIAKHGCIADPEYFGYIENHIEDVQRLDASVMLELVRGSVAIKASVVNRDERETGLRRILNFGHTFGHAFEKTLGISHGAAVSLGMVLASDLSRHLGLIQEATAQRVRRLLADLGLPVRIDFDAGAVTDALLKDKKRDQDQVHFVLLEALGRALVKPIGIDELKAWIVAVRTAA